MLHHRLRLVVGVKEGLRLWVWFLERYNSVDICGLNKEETWDFQIYSDAAGGIGFGLFWQGHWSAEEWLQQWKHGGGALCFWSSFPY